MTKEEIKEAIEDIDDEVLQTIIDCCKELYYEDVLMLYWDKESIMDVLDTVWRKNNQ